MQKNKDIYDDQQICENLLVTLKHMKAEYNTFTQEASNPKLYQEIYDLYDDVSSLQRDVFTIMEEQGWVKLAADTKKNIEKAYKKLNQMKEEYNL